MQVPAKTPTASQKRFAAGLAAGKTKVDAYKDAYPKAKTTKRPVLRARASRSSQSSAVQFELARLVTDPSIMECCPNWQNPHALVEHGIAIMVRLSKCHATDPVIAMRAAEFLIAHGEKQLPIAPKTRTIDHAKIVSDLKGLYAKALNAPPIELESSDEAAAAEAVENPENSQ